MKQDKHTKCARYEVCVLYIFLAERIFYLVYQLGAKFNTLYTSNTTRPSDVIIFSLLFIIFQLTLNFG